MNVQCHRYGYTKEVINHINALYNPVKPMPNAMILTNNCGLLATRQLQIKKNTVPAAKVAML